MNNLKTLNKYFLRYKKKLFLGFVFILLSNAFQVYIPLQLRNGINEVIGGGSNSELIKFALLIVGAAFFSGLFRFLIRETIIVVSREIEYDLRQDFWSRIQTLPFKFFQNNSTGNIMAHATNDISAVRMYIGPAVMYSVDTVTKFVIVISIMVAISPVLTFYTLVPLPLLSFFVYQLSKRIHKKFTRIQEKFSELTTKAQENFSGIRVIKSYVREESEIDLFKKISREYLNRNMDKVKIQALFMPILFLISGLSIIIVVWAGGSMVIEGTLTLGDLSAFIIYLGLLIWPMIAFGWILNIIQQASASMKRLLKIMKEKSDITERESTDYTIKQIDGDIEFKHVKFRYKDNLPYVLNDVNIKIPKGSTVAFVGHTGVGKTTLVNLIARLYDVTEGELFIDGVNVKNIPLRTLRKNIGMVPQETFLFSDTLKSNILYGASDKSLERMMQAVKIARIDKDVEEFPQKYDTVLGERGITLSGGQKQRTCLARAIAVDPKILILDDSFSAVDTNTEEEILTQLQEFMKGRTSIIISHRISTVKSADKIFVLDNGKIVEEGTHDELVALKGIYADIHFRQQLEEELEEIG